MRIHGRILRPATLAERRFLLGCLGVPFIRVARSQNPFIVARRLRQAVRTATEALAPLGGDSSSAAARRAA